MQMSTTRSSFDQYCISHKTISHQAAAVSGPEVRRECPDDLISSFAPPRNKSWQCHWIDDDYVYLGRVISSDLDDTRDMEVMF